MIYDCFTFLNELDLLEIRLRELSGAVDRFVIVEATKTFSGNDKPLLFAQNRERFRQFEDRIIHVAVTDAEAPDVRELPFYRRACVDNPQLQALIDANPAAWSREAHQRNCIARGLSSCAPDDVILIGDLDELPNPRAFGALRDLAGVKVFRQRLYYYYLNCLAPDPWDGTKAIRYSELARTTPQEVRANAAAAVIDDGGWHFSYLGGLEQIETKIRSFSHQELNTEAVRNRENLAFNIENNLDIYGRGMAYEVVPVDDSFPEHIRRHRFRYRRLIHRDRHTDENTRWLREQVLRLRAENEALKARLRG